MYIRYTNIKNIQNNSFWENLDILTFFTSLSNCMARAGLQASINWRQQKMAPATGFRANHKPSAKSCILGEKVAKSEF